MRYKEVILGTLATVALIELSTCSFSSTTKKIKRAERTDLTPDTRTEMHHKLPKYRGGTDTFDNALCATLPEHATAHLDLALEAETRDDRSANFWAVSQIVRRMLPQELTEFNQVVNKRKT